MTAPAIPARCARFGRGAPWAMSAAKARRSPAPMVELARSLLHQPEREVVEAIEAQQTERRRKLRHARGGCLQARFADIECVARNEFRAQCRAACAGVEVLAEVVIRLTLRVAIRPVSAQVKEAKSLSLHEGMHVAERRLALVQFEELDLQLDDAQTFELSSAQRRKDLELGALGVQLHQHRHRTMVLDQEVGKRHAVDVDDAAHACIRTSAVLEDDGIVRWKQRRPRCAVEHVELSAAGRPCKRDREPANVGR